MLNLFVEQKELSHVPLCKERYAAIFFIMFLIFPFFLLSQEPVFEIRASKQSWSGGFSYASGTDYNVFITAQTDLSDFEIERIAIDGHAMTSGWQLTNISRGFRVYFCIRHDAALDVEADKKDFNLPKDHKNNSIRVKIKGKIQEFPIHYVQETPPPRFSLKY